MLQTEIKIADIYSAFSGKTYLSSLDESIRMLFSQNSLSVSMNLCVNRTLKASVWPVFVINRCNGSRLKSVGLAFNAILGSN